MWYGWHDGWGWGAWLAMALMMLAFWGLLAALVVWVVRSGWHTHTHPAPPPEGAKDPALSILDERFARGEIDAEEYRARRDLLRSP